MKPPKELKASGRRFWRKVNSDFDLVEFHHFELLRQSCFCLDRIETAQKEVEKDGKAFIQDRFGQLREHPALKVEKDNRILFARLLRELGLDIATTESRPPAQY